MAINASPISIPFATAVGATVKVDFSDAMKQADIGAVYGDRQGFSGGYMHYLNDTDFALYGTYNNSGMMCVLLPGQEHYCPINTKDTNVAFVVTGKNAAQVHPQELLHVFYLDRGDIASGHQVIASAGLNPSVPAASIGAGALPDTVAIGTDPLTAPQSTNSPLPNDERVGVELFGGGDSGVYGGGNSAFLGTRDGAVLLKSNNYWDGTNDRFIKAATRAIQFFVYSTTGFVRLRIDDGTNRVVGGIITWATTDSFTIFSTTGATTMDSGKISSDGTGLFTMVRAIFNGVLSSGNQIMNLQQNYGYFSDNTGTLGTTRNWVDGPDRGEMHIGPRTGANYFDWIRLRGTKVTIDLGKNASTNPILFEVTGGKTQLDNNNIHSDGSGNLTALSFIGPLTGNVTGNVSGSAGSVAASGVAAGALTEGVTIGADDITAENLASGVKQQNGSTVAGLESAGGGAAGTRIWVGTTDPGGSAAEGDVWIPL